MKRGICVVVVGVVASGKTTIIERLVGSIPGAAMMRTFTTRPPRRGELQNGDRIFVTREEFLSRVESGDIFEHNEFSGHLYGSSRQVLEALLEKHRVVFVNINVDGALKYKEQVPGTVTVFVDAPNEDLVGRIRARSPMSDEDIAWRMKEADRERGLKPAFEYTVWNPDGELDAATARAQEIVESRLE